MREGLSEEEARTAIVELAKSFEGAKVVTAPADDEGLIVVAIRTESNGEVETWTVCRQGGIYALLNTDGQPVAEAETLSDVLSPV